MVQVGLSYPLRSGVPFLPTTDSTPFSRTREPSGCFTGMSLPASRTRSSRGTICCTNGPILRIARSEALAALIREAQRLSLTRSEVTLGLHLDVFFHTYIPTRTAKSGFEDSLDCPLADLELLQQVGERRGEGFGRREPVYAFRREAKPEVTAALFEYCLDDYWRHNRPSESTLAYRDVAIAPRSVGQVFKLPENDVRGRLDRYAGTDASLPFRYQPSAVQGLVSRRNEMESDFLASVYGREASGE